MVYKDYNFITNTQNKGKGSTIPAGYYVYIYRVVKPGEGDLDVNFLPSYVEGHAAGTGFYIGLKGL